MSPDPIRGQKSYAHYRERVNRYRRNRRATDPAYRERQNAYQRAYYASHPELRTYHRDWKRRADEAKWYREHPGALHELACTNDPCTCSEVIIAVVHA